jgi:hypothetical protein
MLNGKNIRECFYGWTPFSDNVLQQFLCRAACCLSASCIMQKSVDLLQQLRAPAEECCGLR